MMNVLIPMWWGGFSEGMKWNLSNTISVLIPMWWGGFSEAIRFVQNLGRMGLNPHVVGRFFRA